jgi:hypothetical protein
MSFLNGKGWHKSKTIWSAILMLVCQFIPALGGALGDDDKVKIINVLSQVGEAISFFGIIYGRMTATHKIGKE